VGGRAIKGPTAKIMAELGLAVSSRTIAEHYGDFLDCLILDRSDGGECDALAALSPQVALADTVMHDEAGKIALAREMLAIAATITATRTT
jgi:LPPG:FO 2-phospho-L-lactate transferase